MKDLLNEFNLFAKQQLTQHFEDEKQKVFNELVQKIEIFEFAFDASMKEFDEKIETSFLKDAFLAEKARRTSAFLLLKSELLNDIERFKKQS